MNRFDKTMELFGDYRFEITVADTWESKVDSVYMYFYSKKFATLMSQMFRDEDNPFVVYLPRKLRSDTFGCLAMGMPGVEHSENRESQTFYNGGEEIDVSEYYQMVGQLRHPFLSSNRRIAQDIPSPSTGRVQFVGQNRIYGHEMSGMGLEGA